MPAYACGMHRRTLFALPLLLAAGPLPELMPPVSQMDQDRAILPIGQGFSLPALRARVMAVLHLLGTEIVALSFGLDTTDTRQDWLALVGPDGRLLALDLLSWAGPDAGTIGTRLATRADQRHITLARAAARHGGRTGWLREAWTDYWRWTGSELVNAPPRPVLEGTWQDGLAQRRIAIARLLTPPRYAVTAELMAEATAPPGLLDRLPFPQ